MKRAKRTVEWESYTDGLLKGSGTYRNRTIYADKNGDEWFNDGPQKRKLENGKIIYRATMISKKSINDIIRLETTPAINERIEALKNLEKNKKTFLGMLDDYVSGKATQPDLSSLLKDLDKIYK